MPLPNVTELALRAAVNTAERSLLGNNDQAQAIKTIANKRAQEQITGSSDGSSMLGQFSLQSAAIDLALVGVAAALNGFVLIKIYRRGWVRLWSPRIRKRKIYP
jgi:hypothetical protein